mmetsp:Transcript_39282/g.117425  ORF Transcript_39282/g.117425 Transcript_39282/m.117425 type:complete len:230 (+) Transcript_39282:275-964(+)
MAFRTLTSSAVPSTTSPEAPSSDESSKLCSVPTLAPLPFPLPFGAEGRQLDLPVPPPDQLGSPSPDQVFRSTSSPSRSMWRSAAVTIHAVGSLMLSSLPSSPLRTSSATCWGSVARSGLTASHSISCLSFPCLLYQFSVFPTLGASSGTSLSAAFFIHWVGFLMLAALSSRPFRICKALCGSMANSVVLTSWKTISLDRFPFLLYHSTVLRIFLRPSCTVGGPLVRCWP